MKSKSIIWQAILAVMIFSLLASCAPAEVVTPETVVETVVKTEVVEKEVYVTEEPEPINGTLTVWGFSEGDEIASVRVDQFREKYPDVELNIVEGSLDKQQFLTAVASGNVPDLIYTNRDDLSTYASRGALLPLDDYIKDHGIDMSQYRESAVAQVTVSNSLYGIPEFFNIIVVLVNDVALEDAGLTLEDIDTSDWDKLADVNEQLTRITDGEVTRIGFDPKLPEFLPLWVRANGGKMISDDGTTAMLNSPEVIEALEFTASLHEPAGGRSDFMAFRDTWDFFGSENQFANDQIGAFPMEQWYLNVLVGASPDIDLSVVPFYTRDGEMITYATGNTWALPRGSKNVDAAVEFMKTVTSVDAWTAAAQTRADMRAEEGTTYTGTYSANKWADEIIFGEILQPSGIEMFDEAIQVVVEAMDNAFSMTPNPAGAEFKQAWQDAVNRVLSGEQTAAEALEQAQQEAQEALDEAWSR
ncbi:MAG: extracellular solute-binding protein [Chloroflexota bacterium]|jgi:multiple sugar transport system substrate-binding protein|nr:extracellular solute-binding protein [Chloroflexota bacterium]